MPATVFDKPIFPGAKQILCQLTVTNTSGSYSHTEQDERITSAMSANRIEVTDPSVFRGRISITTANGSYTISCAEVSGETAVKISFLKIVDDQQFVTSTEFDLLDNRIGDLSDLETTDQTSMVNAVNEVVGYVSSNTQAIATLNSKLTGFGDVQTFTVDGVSFSVRKNPLGFALINASQSSGDATQEKTFANVLPSGYRPIVATTLACSVYSTDAPRIVVISTNGNIVFRKSPTAGNGFSLACMYPCEQ